MNELQTKESETLGNKNVQQHVSSMLNWTGFFISNFSKVAWNAGVAWLVFEYLTLNRPFIKRISPFVEDFYALSDYYRDVENLKSKVTSIDRKFSDWSHIMRNLERNEIARQRMTR